MHLETPRAEIKIGGFGEHLGHLLQIDYETKNLKVDKAITYTVIAKMRPA